MIVVSKNISYMRIFAILPRGGASNNTCYRIPASMQPALHVYYSACCKLLVVTINGRGGPILSVSSIISIIVAYTGRVL